MGSSQERGPVWNPLFCRALATTSMGACRKVRGSSCKAGGGLAWRLPSSRHLPCNGLAEVLVWSLSTIWGQLSTARVVEGVTAGTTTCKIWGPEDRINGTILHARGRSNTREIPKAVVPRILVLMWHFGPPQDGRDPSTWMRS